MKIKGYVIAQAIARKYGGLKTTDGLWGFDAALFFMSEEGAKEYLSRVLQHIKNDIAHGRRDNDNLDPDKWLDFAISPAEIEIDEDKMKSKNWELPHA